MKEGAEGVRLSDFEIEKQLIENFNYLCENSDKTFQQLQDEVTATGAAVAGTGDDPVHWGKPRGRKPVIGRGINGLSYLKRRNKRTANTVVKSSYPRSYGKLESKK
jgi:hypothetical protein